MPQQLFKEEVYERRTDDRRSSDIQYNRRNYDRRSKTFKYLRTIHLTDTNMFGSVYFARFFDLQGEAREEFLQFFMGDDLTTFMQQQYGMVTVNASCNYKGPLFLYDIIVVKLQVTTIKRTKFKLNFTTMNTGNNLIAAQGEQWIGFTNKKGCPCAIPEIILKNLKKHLQLP